MRFFAPTGPDIAGNPSRRRFLAALAPAAVLPYAPAPTAPADDYSVRIPAGPGDAFGTEVRIMAFPTETAARAACGDHPDPLLYHAADGSWLAVLPFHVPTVRTPRVIGGDR